MIVPEGWRCASLAEWGIQAQPGFASGNHHRNREGVLHLRPMNISRTGDLDLADAKYVEDDSPRRVLLGDVLFNNTNSPALVGKTAVVGAGGPYAYSNHMTRLRSDPSVLDSRFLARQLYWKWSTGYFEAICSNYVNQASISSRRLMSVEIQAPSLREQRRIVAILEEHLSDLDDAESSLSHVVARSAGLRQSGIDARLKVVIADLVESKTLGSRTSGREPNLEFVDPAQASIFDSLEALTDPRRVIRYGILKPHTEVGGEVPYVEVRDLKEPLSLMALKRTSRELDEQYAGARLRGGDVVIAVRGSYERTRVVPAELEGANISRDVARIAPLPGLDAQFLHYWLQSTTTKRYLHRHARGVAVKGVNIGSLRALPVPRLPMADQVKAAAEITDIEESVRRLGLAAESASVRAARLRRALLSAAFCGRLTGHGSDAHLISEPTEEQFP